MAQDPLQGQSGGVGLRRKEGLQTDRRETGTQKMVCGLATRSQGWSPSFLCDDRSFLWVGLCSIQLQQKVGSRHWYLEKGLQCGCFQLLWRQVRVRAFNHMSVGISSGAECSLLARGTVRCQEVAAVWRTHDLGCDIWLEVDVLEDQA